MVWIGFIALFQDATPTGAVSQPSVAALRLGYCPTLSVG